MKIMNLLLLAISITLGCDFIAREESSASSEVNRIQAVENSPELKTGDLIFHTSKSSQSKAIQIVTNSKYSHMGIIYKTEDKTYVYEAVQPVKMTPLDQWIKRGVKGKYVVKRLKNRESVLTPEGIQRMKNVGKKYLNKDYDLRFEWSDDKIYCSELVWKIYKEAFDIEIGTLEKIDDFDLSDEIVKQKVMERYGGAVPENEWVITPDRMFHASNLIKVTER